MTEGLKEAAMFHEGRKAAVLAEIEINAKKDPMYQGALLYADRLKAQYPGKEEWIAQAKATLEYRMKKGSPEEVLCFVIALSVPDTIRDLYIAHALINQDTDESKQNAELIVPGILDRKKDGEK